MSAETVNQDLSGVAETLLIPLYIRAMESQRPDALIKDEKAVALVTQKSSEGIRLLDDWGFLDLPEPRLARIRWLRHIPLLARALRVYHFQLGEAAG